MSLKSKLQVWLPRRARPKWTCTVPTGDGEVCGAKFYDGEHRAMTAHVNQCASDNIDHIRAGFAEARPSGFFKPFDPEYAAWARDHGRIG